MYNKVCYKSFNIKSFDKIAVKSNNALLTDEYIYFIRNSEISKYSLTTDEEISLKICGEKIFYVKNMLLVLNKMTLTVYYDKHCKNIDNYPVKEGYDRIVQVEDGLIFMYGNSIDCILSSEKKSFRRIEIETNSLLDIFISGDDLYLKQLSTIYKTKKIVLSYTNSYKHIGLGETIELNEFLTVKKTVVLDNVKNPRLFVTSKELFSYSETEVIKYTLGDKLKEEYRLKLDHSGSEKFAPIGDDDLNCKIMTSSVDMFGEYLSNNDELIHLGSVPISTLHSAIFSSYKNAFLSFDKVYYISPVEIQPRYPGHEIEEFATNNMLTCFSIDPNTIKVPEYIKKEGEDLVRSYVDFKVNVEKWNKIRSEIKKRDNGERNKIIKELKTLRNEIEISVQAYTSKREFAERAIDKLTEKATKKKMETERMRKLMKELWEELDTLKKIDTAEIFSKLKMQRATLKNIIAEYEE